MKRRARARRPRITRAAMSMWLAMALVAGAIVTMPAVWAANRGTGRALAARHKDRSQKEQAAPAQVSLGSHKLSVVAEETEKSGPREQARSPWLDYYIVQLADQPLASYRGTIAGLAATSPQATGARKLDLHRAASTSYRHYLSQKQDEALKAIALKVGHGVDVLHRYDVALNGFAIKLTPEEAVRIRSVHGVVRVERNEFRQLLTDAGPAWIGAPDIWNGENGQAATKGEGIIVGVIDTGINSSHESFADPGPVDGYVYTNPLGVFIGFCDGGGATCNNKLIGQRSYLDSGNDPEDDAGHGSHTASTAAGNYVTGSLVVPTTTVNGDLSGVAPHANIIMYDACTPDGCPTTALVAAINDAAIDGVDVINYSISGGNDPYNDSASLAFLNATAAGVFVSCSAGNNGPGASTTSHNEPWTQSVAASTHNRTFVNSLTNMAGGDTTPPADIKGASLTSSLGATPIVYAGDFTCNGSACDPLCPLGEFPAGTFTGQIVVCDRGGGIARVDKAQSVADGGAGGFVLANDQANGNSLVADGYAVPGVHITYTDGVAVKTWLATGSGHVGEIAGTTTDLSASNGDIMASFSSRGPSSSLPDVLKPDVTAPGVDIWAADKNLGAGNEYQLLSGTSMSSPHSAGAAALLRAQHPTWTPAMVKSAIMLTATPSAVLKEDGVTAANPFDRGAGRVDLTKAGLAGFVLDETAINFAAANPANDGDPTTLNLASLADASCFQTCSWNRTVLSTANVSRTYTGTASAPWLKIASANPFTLAAGAARRISVTADVSAIPKNKWFFQTITWSDGVAGTPDLVMPVAVFVQASTDSLSLTKTVDFDTTAVGARINYSIQVANNSTNTTTFTVTDPVPANTTYVQGSATGGLTFNSGPNTLTGSSGTLAPVSFNLAETPSPFGYMAPGDLSEGFTNVCSLVSSCDDTTLNVSGVDFFYQGTHYTTLKESSNGFMIAGSGASGSTALNQNLPDPADPDNVIAAFWADLDGDGTSGSDPGAGFFYIGAHVDGTQSYTVLGWEGMQLFNDPSKTYTFQIWIKDGSDQISIVYEAFNGGLPDTADGGLTVGLENATGSAGYSRFYRELGSCVPGPCNDSGTAPVVGTDLKVNALLDSATFTFGVTVNNGTQLGTLIQNIASATNGTSSPQAVVDTTVSITPSFADVPTSNPNWREIEAFYQAGITSGCLTNPLRYCPANNVSRAEMAVFIVRAMGETPSGVACNAYFSDISAYCGFAAAYINRLAELGITSGCGAGIYCPTASIQRQQMAVFMVRAIGESPSSVPYNTYFSDIASNSYAGYINKIFELGITSGCGTGLYCPTGTVTRQQMAVFVVRAFDIPIP